MKTDLATAIITGVVGVLVAYFVTNIFIPPIEDFTYTTVDPSVGAEYIEPNIELFNYKALNPTVEVFVGGCVEYDENGDCIDEVINQEDADYPNNEDETTNLDTNPEG